MKRMKFRTVAFAAFTFGAVACGGPDSPGIMDRILDREPQPDSLPQMLNAAPPFRYPPELYAQKVQGNVSLRLFIDQEGKVHPESTTVAETSGNPALDSAAVQGALELKFSPASRKGMPMAVSILYPVFFRHPDGPPLPGDTVLRKGGGGKGDTQ